MPDRRSVLLLLATIAVFGAAVELSFRLLEPRLGVDRERLQALREHVLLNYQLARVYNFVDSPFSLPANNYDLDNEYSYSLNDVPHRLNVSATFELPM